MNFSTVYCLFEQSGTFKNEFKKLGFKAYDYDISNKFHTTDFICDLFNEINNCYNGLTSIFDNFNSDCLVFAFFPCTRFSKQSILHYKCYAKQLTKYSDIEKLTYNMQLINELNYFYNIFCKLVYISFIKGFKLIIENPFDNHNFLNRYFPFEPTIIHYNRRDYGDAFVKPTQYWFFNCQPSNNFIFECPDYVDKLSLTSISYGIKRSLITSSYANRFIREYIL